MVRVTVAIDTDKHSAASLEDTLTSFRVGCKMLESVAPRTLYRVVILSIFPAVFHITHYSVCCVSSSFCRGLRPINVAEDIVINEILDNSFSVSRYTINTEL